MNKDVPSKLVLFIVFGRILGTLVIYGNGVHQDCHEVRLDPARELPCSTLVTAECTPMQLGKKHGMGRNVRKSVLEMVLQSTHHRNGKTV